MISSDKWNDSEVRGEAPDSGSTLHDSTGFWGAGSSRVFLK
jgi:hypothetical protein